MCMCRVSHVLKVFLFHLPLTVQCFAACRHFDYAGFFGCAVFCFESNVWWFVPIHVNYLTSHDLSLFVRACTSCLEAYSSTSLLGIMLCSS